MSIHPTLHLLLQVVDRYPASSVVQLTGHLKPFAPAHDPFTQQAVRTHLKALLAGGLVRLAHTGKPRTYVRTPASYRVVPRALTPDTAASASTPPPTPKR